MRKLICIAFLPLILYACNKDEESQKPEIDETTSNYQPLNIGNYWVYEHFQVGPGNEEKSLEKYDSIFISRDTLIGRNFYSVLEGTNLVYGINQIGILNIVRDSAGNIIDYTGRKLFSVTNFQDTLYSNVHMINVEDTLYSETYSMQSATDIISVPAGNYNALDYRGIINYVPLSVKRYTHNYYADGIGKILSSYFYLSDTSRYFEKRLVRYTINAD